MPSITSSGSGSGIDINGLITQLMTAEKMPLQVLDKKELTFQAKITALGTLKGAMSTFQTAVRGLSDVNKFKSTNVSIADATIGTASSSTIAQAGTSTLEVSQLAQNQKLTTGVYTSVNSPVGTGKITLQFGTVDSKDTPSNTDDTFTVNSAKASITIDITASNNSLAGVRDAVNAANAGVTASILNDGSGNRLVLTSKDSGAANSMRLVVEDTDGNQTDTNGLSGLSYDPTGTRNLLETQTAKDAKLKIDGISVSKPSNTINDAIQGVTLNLLKVTTTPTTITIGNDASGIKTSVQSFVKAFNELNKSLSDLSSYDPKTGKAGILNGETAIRSVQQELRAVLNRPLGSGSFFQSLSEVGISLDKAGAMTLNETKLQQAITSNPGAVANLFTVNGISSDPNIKYISSTNQTVAGKYPVSITSPATQAKFSGSALPFMKIDGANQSASISLAGASSSISIDTGNYTSQQLADQIKSKITANTDLYTSGDTVSVDYNASTKLFDIKHVRAGTPTPTTTSMSLNVANTSQPLTIDANNDSIMVAIDDISSSSIKLKQGAYANPADLAAELQSKINGDASLVKSGKSVIVNFNEKTSSFEILSSSYGSKSNVQISSVGTSSLATLGINIAGIASGRDVVGTIGGEAATGDGQLLTGTGKASGMVVNASASTAGDFGSISFSRGFAFNLDKALDAMLSNQGAIASRVTGVNKSVEGITEQRIRLNRQYEMTEKLYRQQFTAMDIAISNMKNISNGLTSQLANLPK
ncbi:flagellar filament capping protein FliD [Deefgea piscis]|uniref:Flagellar hook-associated protein 2 n=1 Tax=Deefgea piscis TaxID=2739061 RepID=A0A6M8ST65_9NEIS|nr:flagellar filament capping protein FliD [Deefgea piscis]QKJ67891.1 flagellar filament capping protein FliD [Deefgea piscis]